MIVLVAVVGVVVVVLDVVALPMGGVADAIGPFGLVLGIAAGPQVMRLFGAALQTERQRGKVGHILGQQ